jgi:hypothetical protein
VLNHTLKRLPGNKLESIVKIVKLMLHVRHKHYLDCCKIFFLPFERMCLNYLTILRPTNVETYQELGLIMLSVLECLLTQFRHYSISVVIHN